MKLENFIVEGGFTGTTLFGLGRHWDLHSFAETRSLHYEPKTRTLVLEWSVPEMANPWGSPGNRARGCRLLFENVVSLRMTDIDPDASPADDGVIAEVGRRSWKKVPIKQMVLDLVSTDAFTTRLP